MSLIATLTGLLAQSYDYVYTSAYDDVAGAGFLASLGAFYWVFICCSVLIGLVFYGLNIWMFVDVLKRTEAELPNKTLWMVLLVAGFFFGFGGIVAIVYFFVVKKKLDKSVKK